MNDLVLRKRTVFKVAQRSHNKKKKSRANISKYGNFACTLVCNIF
jgi:hypothetical protein